MPRVKRPQTRYGSSRSRSEARVHSQKRGSVKMEYTQADMDNNLAKHTLPGSRRKLAGHYGMTQKAFNDHMGTYKAPKPTKGKGIGGSKAETPGSRTMKY